MRTGLMCVLASWKIIATFEARKLRIALRSKPRTSAPSIQNLTSDRRARRQEGA